MNRDVECPYCGEWQEVCHDDGAGYAEDQRHEMSCFDCDKNFVFTTFISFSYDSMKANCLNGAEHDLEKANRHPPLWPEHVRCKDCDYEHIGPIDKEAEAKYFGRDK